MRWRPQQGGVAILLASLCAVSLPGTPAAARAYAPPGRHIFAGLTGGTSVQPFQRMVGKHPPVFEIYMTWNTPSQWLAPPDPGFRSRLALHISTASSYGGAGVITPWQIAQGRSDAFLVSLGRNLARSGRIVYVRMMGEMNGYWNAYAAYNADGTSRGLQNSPHAYVQAWRRAVLILRGGSMRRINRRLRRLGLPSLQADAGAEAALPSPRLAFLWVPQDAGSPDIAANSPSVFWPGAAYVDWVGTDFYASFPNFARLSAFYGRFSGKPFVLSEWALYGFDDPAFVRELFAWLRGHPRVRMLNYYQGFTPSSRANLARYPASRTTLREELRSPRFLAYAPEFAQPRAGAPPGQPPQPPQPGLVPGLPPLPLGACIPGVPACTDGP